MSDNLPPEILVEILHRLPLKSLVKFTSVCKAWKSLITDHTFIFDHLNRTIQATNGNDSLFLHLVRQIWEWPERKYLEYEEFYSLYSDYQQTDHLSFETFPWYKYSLVVGTCDGLVCSADYSILDSATILIWNPSIRKYVLLPKPIVTFRRQYPRYGLFFGFGFDSWNNDYKVVRIVTLCNEQDNPPQVEVYSLASHSWRSITVRVPQFLLFKYFYKIPQVFVNGAVHWVLSRRSECDDQFHYFILSFDIVEETFGELTLPHHLRESPELYILGGGHSLAILHRNLDGFSIWVMKEYGVVESWTEVFCCDSKCYGGISTILALTSRGKVVLRLDGGTIVLLDPTKDLMKPLGGRQYFQAFVGSYVESLFLINKEPGVFSY